MSMTVVIPTGRNKLIKQIEALEYQIENDTDEKSKIIHKEALAVLKEALQKC